MSSPLAGAVDRVLAVAATNPRLPEAETKAVLIEPILDALGWDTRDLASVRREVPVAGGTNVDYGLLDAAGDVRLHVEAKALGTRLGIKVVTQTVNYANGAGVPWAVLTDGLHWHVLWSNAPVANDRKEVFAVDLTGMSGPDTRGIGHHGHGDVMAPLTTTDEIEDRLALVDEAIAAHDAS